MVLYLNNCDSTRSFIFDFHLLHEMKAFLSKKYCAISPPLFLYILIEFIGLLLYVGIIIAVVIVVRSFIRKSKKIIIFDKVFWWLSAIFVNSLLIIVFVNIFNNSTNYEISYYLLGILLIFNAIVLKKYGLIKDKIIPIIMVIIAVSIIILGIIIKFNDVNNTGRIQKFDNTSGFHETPLLCD